MENKTLVTKKIEVVVSYEALDNFYKRVQKVGYHTIWRETYIVGKSAKLIIVR